MAAESDDDPCKGFGQRRCPICKSMTHVDQQATLSYIRRCNDDECKWCVAITGTSNFK